MIFKRAIPVTIFRAVGLWAIALCGFGISLQSADSVVAEPGINGRSSENSRMELLDDERILRVGDRLLFRVLEEREQALPIFVNDQGQINLPLVGQLDARGKTCRALAYEIKSSLEKTYFYRATVILDFQYSENTRGQVNVAGAVRNQRAYPIPNDRILTVSGAIISAGGMTAEADPRRVVLVRRNQEGEEQRRFEINVQEVLDAGNLEADMPVQADDLIVVPRRTEAGGTAYVVGAVNSPGVINVPADGSLTVSGAILQRGGFSRFARQRTVKLIRGDSSVPIEERTRTINVEAILERGARENDIAVEPDDIIRVEERLIAF